MSSETSKWRYRVTLNHIEPQQQQQHIVQTSECASSASLAITTTTPTTTKLRVDVDALRKHFDGEERLAKIKNITREFLAKGELKEAPDMEYKKFRYLTTEWAYKVVKAAPIKPTRTLRDKPDEFFSWIEMIGFFNMSLFVKLAVQFNLWGGTVANLGTERHAHLIDRIDTLDAMGCFGMTEIGHGSNVRGLETTATYDKHTHEFVIHSPTDTAAKFWIGNAANDGKFCTVFANLVMDGKRLGIHAFIVPLRDEFGNVCKGVTIRDCGHKFGLNGVDNGDISFDHVRIPQENMLNRYSDVSKDGVYQTKLANEAQHFGTTISELSGGRVIIGCGALSASKVGLTIAIRYAAQRLQFSSPKSNGVEVPIITLPTHYRRLMPLLARTVAMDSLKAFVIRKFTERTHSEVPFVHSLTAGLKAFASWHNSHTLDVCRQCCGGQGYRSMNKLPTLIADTHIFLTFEGDNTVLMQQVAKFLIAEFTRQSKAAQFSGVFHYKQNKNDFIPVGNSVMSHLTNTKWLASLLEAREDLLLQQLIAAIRSKHKDEGFHENLNTAVRLGRVHMDRLMHETFLATIDSSSSSSKPVLERLYQLSALHSINEDLGFFVAHEIVSPKLARYVDAAITALSREVADISLDICAAFGIPQTCLPEASLTKK